MAIKSRLEIQVAYWFEMSMGRDETWRFRRRWEDHIEGAGCEGGTGLKWLVI
jgi:hypothetical protein